MSNEVSMNTEEKLWLRAGLGFLADDVAACQHCNSSKGNRLRRLPVIPNQKVLPEEKFKRGYRRTAWYFWPE